jgi:hypothetical protein
MSFAPHGMAVEPSCHPCTAFAVLSRRICALECVVTSVLVPWRCGCLSPYPLSDEQCTACKHGYVGCKVVQVVPAYCCVSSHRLSVVR